MVGSRGAWASSGQFDVRAPKIEVPAVPRGSWSQIIALVATALDDPSVVICGSPPLPPPAYKAWLPSRSAAASGLRIVVAAHRHTIHARQGCPQRPNLGPLSVLSRRPGGAALAIGGGCEWPRSKPESPVSVGSRRQRVGGRCGGPRPGAWLVCHPSGCRSEGYFGRPAEKGGAGARGVMRGAVGASPSAAFQTRGVRLDRLAHSELTRAPHPPVGGLRPLGT